MGSRTLYKMFQESVQQHGTHPAVGFKRGKEPEYTYWTYSELASKVQALRRGLDALGLQKGDRVALLSENRVEWAMTDLAIQSLGLINVSIYPSLPAAQVAYIVHDSAARLLLVSDTEQRKKVTEIRAVASGLEFVVAMEGEAEVLSGENILAFEEVFRRGETSGKSQEALDTQLASVTDNDVATFIYTSGTTGDPKGAMLTHSNLLQTPDAVIEEPVADLGPNDVFLSFLPVSHITERVGCHYLALRAGACIVYSQGLRTLKDEIQTTVRPTAMLCVPRLFEMMYGGFKDKMAKEPEDTQKKAAWALEIGREAAQLRSEGKGTGLMLAGKLKLAEIGLSKIRTAMTGGRMRFLVSGGAPLDLEIATFFLSIGVNILEGYGLSETNIIAINRPGKQRIGTVGKLMPKVEVQLAADGEILMRGQGRMAGYHNKPEATAEAIDSAGWFRTGDIGEISSDGYLKITDRKKDLLVLTNGKKVAPQPIEAQLKHSPYIGEAVLFGDKQPTIMALLVPAMEKLKSWAKAENIAFADVAELISHPAVQKLYKAEIEKYTPNLADYEKIKRFRLIDSEFSIESGELTPTLKVKRKFVAQKYADVIAEMAR